MRRCCLELISILIGEEPEPGMRDLDKVAIPSEMSRQLDRLGETGGAVDSVASQSGGSLVSSEVAKS